MREILLFSLSAGFSYVLNLVLIRYSKRVKALPVSESTPQVRWASRSKPIVGGITFFVVFLLAVAAGLLLPGIDRTDVWAELTPMLLASTVGFAIGLADDAFNTRPLLKFSGQVACGAILVTGGVSIQLLGNPVADGLLTLFWVVGIMNSINMLDNMDGITGSVTFGVLATTLGLHMVSGLSLGFDGFVIVALIGSVFGFLILNWNPSKLYMGDTGSQFIGLFLAYVGIRYFWNYGVNTPGDSIAIFSRQALMPILVFLMAIMDTSFVTYFRIKRGQSPAIGGRDHITHHLVYFGIREKYVPLITGSVTLLSGSIALSAVLVAQGWSYFHTGLYSLYIITMSLVFLGIYLKGLSNKKQKEAAQAVQQPAPKLTVPAAATATTPQGADAVGSKVLH